MCGTDGIATAQRPSPAEASKNSTSPQRPGPTLSFAAFRKYRPAVIRWSFPGYGAAPRAVVRSAMAVAEYGPFAQSIAWPDTRWLYASQNTGTSALSSRNSASDLVIERRRAASGVFLHHRTKVHSTSAPISAPKNHPSYRVAAPPARAMPQFSSTRSGPRPVEAADGVFDNARNHSSK